MEDQPSAQLMSGIDLLLGGVGNDGAEAQQMAPFQPGTKGGQMAWWESVAAYGITRAIDNRFGPANVQGNVNPGTFAGQNGRTYSNQTNQSGMAQATAQPVSVGFLALLGLGAFLAMA